MDDLNKAIFTVMAAVDQDKRYNYEDALRLYEEGISLLEDIANNDNVDEKTKDNIRNKCPQYSKRAELIKDYVNSDRYIFKCSKSTSHNMEALLEEMRKAVIIVTRAVEEDKRHNYEEALRLYEEGVELFQDMSKRYLVEERAKLAVKVKCETYSKRANLIRKHLDSEDRKEILRKRKEKLMKTIFGCCF